MAMYSQALIHRLDSTAKQIQYANISAAGSSLERLRRWSDLLVEIGPLYGYFPNGSKTHVLAKPDNIEAAKDIFNSYLNRRRVIPERSSWNFLVCTSAC